MNIFHKIKNEIEKIEIELEYNKKMIKLKTS